MGCFNPARSDLDLLVVVDEGMTVETKREVAALLLNQSTAPHPIEISFLYRQDLTSWRFPTPFDFHYSETWRARYQADLASGNWQRWDTARRTDPDLAAHITILHARGIPLVGSPIATVFPPVPRADYLAAILGDFADARDAIVDHPLYGILNLCRVYWYVRDSEISSKVEAGRWAARTLLAAFRPMARQAVGVYQGTRQEGRWAPEDLLAFAHYVDGRVQALCRSMLQDGRQ
jgi:streptomycin 3"-adenylyltransferase